jgi:hypothetical protein
VVRAGGTHTVHRAMVAAEDSVVPDGGLSDTDRAAVLEAISATG